MTGSKKTWFEKLTSSDLSSFIGIAKKVLQSVRHGTVQKWYILPHSGLSEWGDAETFQ